MPRSNDSGERLYTLMNAIAEEVLLATDEEIARDVAAEGGNVEDRAARVRSVLLRSVQDFKKNRLHAAVERHKQSTKAYQMGAGALPLTPSERRTMLDRVLKRAPDVTSMVAITIQHRDFKSLSDEDVESVLRQLQHLGLLDTEEGEESDE